MVLKPMDTHMQKNDVRYKNELQMDYRPKRKS